MNQYKNIYDCPIELQLGEIETLHNQELGREIIRTVQKVGISIDRDGLIEAINNDHKRYEEAYNKGYSDCKKLYDETLRSIAKLTGYSIPDQYTVLDSHEDQKGW